MRTEGNQEIAISQPQCSPLVLGSGAKLAVGDLHRASRLVGSGGDIKRVQHERKSAAVVERVHYVDCSAAGVNYRRTHDSRVAVDIHAARAENGIRDRRAQVDMPILRSAIGIEGVHAVIRGRNVDYVVRATANADVGCHQGRGIYLVVYRVLKQQAKLGGVYVAWRQYGLIQVLPGSPEVVVLGKNTDLGRCEHVGQQ